MQSLIWLWPISFASRSLATPLRYKFLCRANGKEFNVQAATIYESSLPLELLIDSESPPFEFALRRQSNVMQVLGLRQA